MNTTIKGTSVAAFLVLATVVPYSQVCASGFMDAVRGALGNNGPYNDNRGYDDNYGYRDDYRYNRSGPDRRDWRDNRPGSPAQEQTAANLAQRRNDLIQRIDEAQASGRMSYSRANQLVSQLDRIAGLQYQSTRNLSFEQAQSMVYDLNSVEAQIQASMSQPGRYTANGRRYWRDRYNRSIGSGRFYTR